MQKLHTLVLLGIFSGTWANAIAASGPTTVTPGQEHWTKLKDKTSIAVLYGNPDKPGFTVIRIKVPAHWSTPLHYHARRENVTVMSGIVYGAFGERPKEQSVAAYPAGSFISVPANMSHYAFTKSQGAVMQLEGEGPFQDIILVH